MRGWRVKILVVGIQVLSGGSGTGIWGGKGGFPGLGFGVYAEGLSAGIWGVRGGSQSRDFRGSLGPGSGCCVGPNGKRIWELNRRSGCSWGKD